MTLGFRERLVIDASVAVKLVGAAGGAVLSLAVFE